MSRPESGAAVDFFDALGYLMACAAVGVTALTLLAVLLAPFVLLGLHLRRTR